MSANLDRFSTGVTPTVALEVGGCNGCGGVMYDYEVRLCPACDSEVHQGCVEKCERCGRDGCRACLIQDPDTGERRCPDNCESEVKHDNRSTT